MSTSVIVALIAAGLFILVSFAVIMQSIEKNKQEKRLLESSLLARARNFQHLLEGFPDGFLGRDLQLLVCKCLLDVYQQLGQLRPNSSEYKKFQAVYAERIEQQKNSSSNNPRVSLSNQQQIREVQKLLTTLHSFIAKLVTAKSISNAEAVAYSKQVKRLMAQTTIDGLVSAINEAFKENKEKLALHHMKNAVTKMSELNGDGSYSNHINEFNERIASLEQELDVQDKASKQRRKEADEEWDELNKPDDSWKKKAIYD